MSDSGKDEEVTDNQSASAPSVSGFAAALISLLEMRNPQIGAHCRRVAQFVRDLAGISGLGPAEIEELELAGLLHDIGFLIGPREADGQLLMERMKAGAPRHPVYGYAAIRQIPGQEKIAEAILYHHEHYDGSGFPHQLRGDKIPLYSRILAVADAYDLAMYLMDAKTRSTDVARDVLARERGVSLDPDLVNRFLFVLTSTDPMRRHNDKEIQISPTALRPGMVLSRDLRSVNKVMLLKADTVLTQEMIDRLLSSQNVDWLITLAYVAAESIAEEFTRDMRREEPVFTPKPAPIDLKPPADVSRPQVLAVDDAIAVSNALRRELGREGIDVTGVASVPEALALLNSKKFDAVITDLVIGTMSGFDLLREMQKSQPDLRFVILSGFPTPANVRALRDYENAVRFVTKPWQQPVLLKALREAMNKTGPTPADAAGRN